MNGYSIDHIDVVVVDDSQDILDILGIILGDYGYNVRTYGTAEAVLRDVPSSFIPDLFLLDVNLPGMSGLTLCRSIKETPVLNLVPVIFISGLMEDSDKKEGFEAGGEDYISKPFSKSDVLARVKTHIKLRRSLQELQLLNTDLESRIVERTRELQSTKDEAEKANRAKTEFLSNINHEMRTPLNGILGMLNLLKDISMDQEGATYLSLAEYSANHLSVIIRDILDYSQLETHRMIFHYNPVNIGEMMKKMCTIQRADAKAKGLEIRLIHPDKESLFTGDETRLYQILINLLSNSIKYSRKGVITIRYRVEDDLHIEVQDQGIGIPPDKVEDVFLPFLQLDASYTKENKGIGLGLSITRNLVKSMDGTIDLKSDSNGTSFTIIIPDKKVSSVPLALEGPEYYYN